MERLLDLIYPRRATCLACGSLLGCDEDDICDACLVRLAESRVGIQDVDPAATGLAGAAHAFAYRGAAGGMVRSLKYGSVRVAAKGMAREIAQAAMALEIEGLNCVTAVPMHPKRERERICNHAEVLAGFVAAELGVPYKRLLARTRNAPQQARLNREERLENLKNAFYVPDAAQSEVRDAVLLLIDDVWTTGATAINCARTLNEAGAGRVYFASYAIAEREKRKWKK